jgi:quercetin dioxygenase-like cupin family protein
MRAVWLVVVMSAAGILACSHGRPPGASGSSDSARGPFRRVVTGLDANGRSTIVEDGPVPRPARASLADFPPALLAEAPFLRYVLESDAVWFGALPLPAGAPVDPLAGALLPSDGITPTLPRGGFAAAMVRWAPGGPAFPMHDSPTVDLVVVISGELELRLDAGSTVLRSGDVVVQRGTRHTWKVVGTQPCEVLLVLLDALGPAAPP